VQSSPVKARRGRGKEKGGIVDKKSWRGQKERGMEGVFSSIGYAVGDVRGGQL